MLLALITSFEPEDSGDLMIAGKILSISSSETEEDYQYIENEENSWY